MKINNNNNVIDLAYLGLLDRIHNYQCSTVCFLSCASMVQNTIVATAHEALLDIHIISM